MRSDPLCSDYLQDPLNELLSTGLITLPIGFIKPSTDLEAWFLTHFNEDDTKVTMPTIIEEKQKKGDCEIIH